MSGALASRRASQMLGDIGAGSYKLHHASILTILWEIGRIDAFTVIRMLPGDSARVGPTLEKARTPAAHESFDNAPWAPNRRPFLASSRGAEIPAMGPSFTRPVARFRSVGGLRRWRSGRCR